MTATRTKQGLARPSSRRKPKPVKRVLPLALILAVASVSLGGCGNMLQRIADVGKEPAIDPIENRCRRR